MEIDSVYGKEFYYLEVFNHPYTFRKQMAEPCRLTETSERVYFSINIFWYCDRYYWLVPVSENGCNRSFKKHLKLVLPAISDC